jgi:Leucine-rich repeat (LRR) protein
MMHRLQVAAGLLLAGAAGLLVHGCPTQRATPRLDCRETLRAWGVPPELCEKQRQLKELHLPDSVEHLSWLRATRLEELHVEGAAGLTRVGGLPSSLRRLSLRGSGVASLQVPLQVERLDLADTAIESLAGLLPDGLRELGLSEIPPPELAHLPESLEILRLTQSNPTRELEDLTALGRLPKLRELELRGQEILSLEGVPESVERLAIEVVRLKFVSLPERLRGLSLVGGGPLEVDEFPRAIESLTLLDWLPGMPIGEASPYLNVLEVGGVGSGALVALPATLLELQWFGGGLRRLPELPPDLRVLRLSAGELDLQEAPSVLRDLPSGLVELALVGYPRPGLPELPGGLRVLDVSWSGVRRLVSLDSLRCLDLTGVNLDTDSPLPQGLATLIWQAYPDRTLRSLPPSVTSLDVSNSLALKEIPSLPPKLETLRVADSCIEALPTSLPASLKLLDVSGCANISSLPELPEGLRTLVFSAGQLASLEALPKSVSRVEIVSADPSRVGCSSRSEP